MFKGRVFILVGTVFILTFIFLSVLTNTIYFDISVVIRLLFLTAVTAVITYLVVRKSKDKIETSRISVKMIKIINFILVIIAILVIISTPFFQSSWFYVRHIVIFIIISFLICFNGYLIGSKFMRKYPNKTRIVKIVNLTMVFIGIVLIGNLQLYYIGNYEIPPLYGCSYYDDYGNLIYNSQIAGSCPELENIEKTDLENGSQLFFFVHEEIFRYDDGLVVNRIVDGKYYYDSKIQYEYDSLNRIVDYQINLTISGYYYDEDLQDYKLYRKTVYHKTIENIYEDNRLISNHRIINTVSDEDREIQSLSYDYEYQYISEIKPKEDSNNYLIEVTKVMNTDSGVQLDLLYSIDVNFFNNEYMYIVNKKDKQEYLLLTVEDRKHPNIENNYIIKKEFRSFVYDRLQTEKELYYNIHQSLSDSNKNIFKNEYSRYDPFISTDLDFENNNILRTHQDLMKGFFNFTNIVEETQYGFKINHYHTQRENDLSYKTYNKTIEYSIDYPNNGLSIELQMINNYERALYYPNFYNLELIYQDNPLLMRTYIEEFND